MVAAALPDQADGRRNLVVAGGGLGQSPEQLQPRLRLVFRPVQPAQRLGDDQVGRRVEVSVGGQRAEGVAQAVGDVRVRPRRVAEQIGRQQEGPQRVGRAGGVLEQARAGVVVERRRANRPEDQQRQRRHRLQAALRLILTGLAEHEFAARHIEHEQLALQLLDQVEPAEDGPVGADRRAQRPHLLRLRQPRQPGIVGRAPMLAEQRREGGVDGAGGVETGRQPLGQPAGVDDLVAIVVMRGEREHDQPRPAAAPGWRRAAPGAQAARRLSRMLAVQPAQPPLGIALGPLTRADGVYHARMRTPVIAARRNEAVRAIQSCMAPFMHSDLGRRRLEWAERRGCMATQLLDARQAALFTRERALLDALRTTVAELEATPADSDALRQAALDLDTIFLLVIVGEFNAGKSALINALAGERVMPEGATPTTAAVTLLRYGEEAAETRRANDLVERAMPAAFLRQIAIVDTPGTNAVIRRHEEITREFVPRADLVLFVTSSDRPFTESERAFLELIRDWGKKVVVVLNKIDLLTSDDLAQVVRFVEQNATALLGSAPEIFPVAARLAFAAKQSPDPAERERLLSFSRFGALERYIFETLDESSRLRLKLLNPLGIAERLNARYLAAAEERLAVLREDFRTTENIENQLAVYTEDMRRDFKLRVGELDTILLSLERRGDRFFDQTFRIVNVVELIKSDRIRAAFEREVIADTASQLDERVQGLIDWMVEQELRLWQGVMEYLNRRRQSQSGEHVIGQIGGAFDYNRRQLLQAVARTARQVVEGYDRSAEAIKLAEEMRSAVAQTALTSVGALSLGTLIAVLVGTTAADVTGVLAAVTLGGLGLFIIPAKKRQAQRQFHTKIDELRQQLQAAMTTQFETELSRSLATLRDSIAPYTRFVRAEHEKVSRLHDELIAQMESAATLRAEIDELTGAASLRDR